MQSPTEDGPPIIECEYEAICFDNDGVLIQTTDREILVEAARTAFERFDATPPESFLREFAAPAELPTARIREEFGVDPAAFWEHREEEVAARQRAAIEAGEKALYEDVHAIAELDVPLGLVSNNQHETIEFILEHHGLDEYFETAYGRGRAVDELDRKKPDTHYVERALSDLDVDDALYVGDSEKDVVVAERAGIDSAFVRRDHRRDLTLTAEPTYEVPDLRTLVDGLTAATAE